MGGDWIDPTEVRDRQLALVNVAINLCSCSMVSP